MLSEEELDLLRKLATGGMVFSEYTADDQWRLVSGLRKKGLVESRGIVTGSARITITAAGRAAMEHTC